jgi:hypothetical protein
MTTCLKVSDSAQIVEFECRAHLPWEIEQLLRAAKAACETDNTQVVQKTEVPSLIANLKDLIVRIKNAEFFGQYEILHQSVVECESLKEEIMRDHMKRIGNRGVMSGARGEKVNAMIQKLTELRKGKCKEITLMVGEEGVAVEEFHEFGRFVGIWTPGGTTGELKTVA